MYYEVMDNLDERSELNGNLVDTRAFIFNTTTGSTRRIRMRVEEG